MGESGWTVMGPRAFSRRTRSSAHPHEPQHRRDTEPTANVKAVDDDGVELGADNEERVAQADRLGNDSHPPPVQIGSSSASNAGPNPGGGQRVETEANMDEAIEKAVKTMSSKLKKKDTRAA